VFGVLSYLNLVSFNDVFNNRGIGDSVIGV
jgi:hypothetical protein